MDRITKSLMMDFSNIMEISSKDQSKLFENFSCYSIISKIHNEKFELEDIVGGEGGDCGIDGIGIIVSGIMINTIEEIEDLLDRSGNISEVKFIIIQAKTSSSFNGADMRNFGDGVLDFFSEEPQLVRNDFIRKKAEIVEFIINKAARINKMIIELFYVTTGQWLDDPNLNAKINKIVSDIEAINLFKQIKFNPIGANEIQKFYRQSKEKVSATINFPNRVVMPDIKGINESYTGTLNLTEYLKLIEDELGNIRRSVFYDNVRDYQGENDVNESISNTLQSNNSDRLAVLNNGVTIVAKKVSVARHDFTLEDYQIVNGCQTSHVIYYNKDNIDKEKTNLPVKIIITEDEEVISDIIIANNSQTEVKKEELMALSDFQKKLELFYNSIEESKRKLFYERRSKQYDAVPNIEKVRIVTISSQIKSFASMYLDRPNLASRFYGKLLEQLSESAFVANHQPMPYYTSAFALYKLEFYFRNKSLDSRFRKFRFHMLMMLKYYINNENLPNMDSKKINSYCENINKVLYSSNALSIFKKLTNIIEDTVEDISDTEITKKQSLNAILIEKVTELRKMTV
ncbi:AIPR family protein [Bacillus subtilis]|uniref:AIPR family protein n=1 Tax=Bacillus TaxID=1386 RepID=UPI001425E8E7|nr:AIPR family protein [Bacillus subtilis]MDI6547981.1 AIPR family protein [Bacillus subtilis]MEC1255478.1 AIPR family protein [Bacillus subtilis]MEC1310394.1 AIPR family protein [Bacillus subtilis]MEC2339060.1 AIPR family protein [Bacillus subtilis]MED5592545.1 AIPR family protein [Bacillus subtilis]